jgi:hypothetical protein
VGLARLELATSPLSGVRSNHLSYSPGYGTRSIQGSRREGSIVSRNDPSLLPATFTREEEVAGGRDRPLKTGPDDSCDFELEAREIRRA